MLEQRALDQRPRRRRGGNGATAPGSKPVASTTSFAFATRTSRAPTAAATLRCVGAAVAGDQREHVLAVADEDERLDDLLEPAADGARGVLGGRRPLGELLDRRVDAAAADERRRRVAPARATRAGLRRERRLVRLERALHCDAALDVGAELRQRQLDRGQRDRDVEDVEPADVADAEDLPLQVALARRERDAVRVAQVAQQLGAVDARRARARR